MILCGAGVDAGVKVEAVSPGSPGSLILNVKAYFHGNCVFYGFYCFCFPILLFSLRTFNAQGDVRA